MKSLAEKFLKNSGMTKKKFHEMEGYIRLSDYAMKRVEEFNELMEKIKPYLKEPLRVVHPYTPWKEDPTSVPYDPIPPAKKSPPRGKPGRVHDNTRYDSFF